MFVCVCVYTCGNHSVCFKFQHSQVESRAITFFFWGGEQINTVISLVKYICGDRHHQSTKCLKTNARILSLCRSERHRYGKLNAKHSYHGRTVLLDFYLKREGGRELIFLRRKQHKNLHTDVTRSFEVYQQRSSPFSSRLFIYPPLLA